MEEEDIGGPSDCSDPEYLVPILQKHLYSCVINGNHVYGYIDGDDNFELFTTELAAAGCSYSTRSSEILQNGKFLFSAMKGDVPIDFFQCPFQVLKLIHYECSHGGTYTPRKTVVDSSVKKKRKLLNPTKKVGCPAKMVCKKVLVYPSFTASRNHWTVKKETLRRLRAELPFNPASFIRYYVGMTHPKAHNHLLKHSSLTLNLNGVLIDKIYEIVSRDITHPKVIKQILEEFVHDMFKFSSIKPDIYNSAFYPSEKTIRNHICKAQMWLKKLESVNEREGVTDGPSSSKLKADSDSPDNDLKKYSEEEKEAITKLQDKVLGKLVQLNQLTYEINSISHLQDFSSDLKFCLSKYTTRIKQNKPKLIKKVRSRSVLALPKPAEEEVNDSEVQPLTIVTTDYVEDKTTELIEENKPSLLDDVKLFFVLENVSGNL